MTAQYAPPEAVGVGGEAVTRLRRDHEPPARGDLALELPAIPSGVAGEHAHLLEADGDVVRTVAQVDRPEPREQRAPALGLPVVVHARQTDPRPRRHRAADEDDRREGGERLPFGQRLGEIGVAGPVEDETERTLVTVLEDEHHRPVEVGVGQDRRRHEEPAAEGGHRR